MVLLIGHSPNFDACTTGSSESGAGNPTHYKDNSNNTNIYLTLATNEIVNKKLVQAN